MEGVEVRIEGKQGSSTCSWEEAFAYKNISVGIWEDSKMAGVL